ncbi:MAG: hypothetical protein WCO58_02725 [bacterium]
MKYISILLLPLFFLPLIGNAVTVKKTTTITPKATSTTVQATSTVEIIEPKARTYKIDGIFASPLLRTQARYQKVEKMIAEYTSNGKVLSTETQTNWDIVNKNIELAKSYVDELSSIKIIDPTAKFFASKQNTINSLRDNTNDSNKLLRSIVISIANDK